MKRYLPFVIIAAVAVLTVGAGTLLYRARPRALPDSAAAERSNAESEHIRGQPDAVVTLEEFGDFQCAPCGTLASILGILEHDYGPRLRVIFRNFPLAMHQHAFEAAVAAEAAHQQGRFWEMHDLLYQNQSEWSKAADVRPLFATYAKTLGLDAARFKKDQESQQVKARVKSDHDRGVSRGVKNTPTIFLNNREVRTLFTLEAVRDAIEVALPANKKS